MVFVSALIILERAQTACLGCSWTPQKVSPGSCHQQQMEWSVAPVKIQKVGTMLKTNAGKRQHHWVTLCAELSAGVSYTLTEEPSDMATQLYTTPAAGSNTLSQFKRRVTVVRANQLPDTIAAAEAVEAVMPSADMPGIPSTTQPHKDDANEAAPPVQQVANATVQQQQQQQQHQAGQDTLATPDDSKQKRKKAKSEAKKLKKQAQETTAINEKQSKLQRQSDTPVLAPEALQVSAAPEVKSEAAQLQDNIEAATPTMQATAAVLASSGSKKRKKDSKDSKKVKKHKERDSSQHKAPKS